MTVCFVGFGTLYSFIHVVHFISHSLFVSFSNQDKLIVDPAAFDLQGSMKEFRNVCSKFKILKYDLLSSPVHG
jgi:hypothetical protein